MEQSHWYEHRVIVQPHHTDYSGVVWHGTYIAWMEEARVNYLSGCGLTFADWVKAGVDLPVVNLGLKYRRSLTLGDTALVKARLEPAKGVRILWHYDIQNAATQETCIEGTVTLAPVDFKTRRILRRLPEHLQTALDSML
ncbi:MULTISPECIES: thioesterase family protein [Cyanophyceae]|uniref:acyl-CoA thioesterase n=1 Tax=Cyanophyceae TaxID=3028117 RepID=UPI001684B702|nr:MULTISPECIES: thioesterase family protein [Cyanophyceae]MBD1916652.1 acyl-CoA thioesterase [Phormidium sp. FACHB-77]MBD2030009.1 acyl-CoA thioesterase [Phormidium sp. FACHB-322]MBD2053220.1 acyl-CoA thioesterase [Leptolyngbya sp. FACHB-60]